MTNESFLLPLNNEKSTDRIIRQIRDGIFKGILQPGTFLGPEKDLAKLFCVSRQTLRETINALEYMGLVYRRKGSGGGVFISKVEEAVAQEHLLNFFCLQHLSSNHLSEVRKALEPHTARMAAINKTDGLLKRLHELNKLCEKAFTSKDYTTLDTCAVEFHKAIGEASGNPLMTFILNFVENILAKIKKELQVDAAFSAMIIEGHKEIYAAIEAGDATRAAQAMSEDIDRVEAGLQRLSGQKNKQKTQAGVSVQDYLTTFIQDNTK